MSNTKRHDSTDANDLFAMADSGMVGNDPRLLALSAGMLDGIVEEFEYQDYKVRRPRPTACLRMVDDFDRVIAILQPTGQDDPRSVASWVKGQARMGGQR